MPKAGGGAGARRAFFSDSPRSVPIAVTVAVGLAALDADRVEGELTDLVNVVLEESGGLATLTLNRPNSLNAVNRQTLIDLDNVCAAVEASNTIKVLIITGAGSAFCAGADLDDVTEVRSQEGGLERFVRTFHRIATRIEDLPVPTIAAIHGFALAGGLELALACDIRIAADNARIGDQHANFALIPGGGASQRLPRLIGLPRAKEIILTGAWLSAVEAERIGLVSQVVPKDELLSAAQAMAEKLLNKSRSTSRTIKRLMNKGMQVDLSSGLEMEIIMAVHGMMLSDDVTEGLKAFAEKRKPVFKAI